MLLMHTFEELISKYIDNPLLAENFWSELQSSYFNSERHYHTLSHLEQMLSELLTVQPKIEDWDTILFALFYHDIIYKATSKQNEEKSAELAEERLMHIRYPMHRIEKCKQIILATKTHIESTDTDINYFTDADLSILGQNWENYLTYAANVRKEYSMYPDLIYKPGRKKVLNHFLRMRRIFKTDFFIAKYENAARDNLTREFHML